MTLFKADKRQSNTEERKFYIVTRLYDYTEKIKAEKVEQAVLKGIEHTFGELGLGLPSRPTFVPFRDSNLSEGILTGKNATQAIYNLDINRIQHAFALVGFIDGVTKDEGVAMEIGYAFGCRIPVLLISTDCLTHKAKGKTNAEIPFDPILMCMIGRLIRQFSLPAEPITFQDRLEAALKLVLDRVTLETQALIRSPGDYIAAIPQIQNKDPEVKQVFIDFGGGMFEWQRMFMQDVAFRMQNLGFPVKLGSRYHPARLREISNDEDFIGLGREDLSNACESDILVISCDDEEMNAGSAALIGMARAMNKMVIIYDSKSVNISEPSDIIMSRNLMIDYAADFTVSKYQDIPLIIHDAMNRKKLDKAHYV